MFKQIRSLASGARKAGASVARGVTRAASAGNSAANANTSGPATCGPGGYLDGMFHLAGGRRGGGNRGSRGGLGGGRGATSGQTGSSQIGDFDPGSHQLENLLFTPSECQTSSEPILV